MQVWRCCERVFVYEIVKVSSRWMMVCRSLILLPQKLVAKPMKWAIKSEIKVGKLIIPTLTYV